MPEKFPIAGGSASGGFADVQRHAALCQEAVARLDALDARVCGGSSGISEIALAAAEEADGLQDLAEVFFTCGGTRVLGCVVCATAATAPAAVVEGLARSPQKQQLHTDKDRETERQGDRDTQRHRERQRVCERAKEQSGGE